MMGRSHAKLGLFILMVGIAFLIALSSGTGLLAVDVPWYLVPVPVLALAVTQYNGGTVAPDIDGPGIATISFWPLTKIISTIVRCVSRLTYIVTRGPRDPKGRGTHRFLTHTAIGNVLAGSILAVTCLIKTPYGPVPAAVATALVAGMGALAIKRSWKWPVTLGTGLACYAILHADPVHAIYWPWIWGTAFAAGCAVHCIGDGCTDSGVPYWWHPFKRGPKRWTRDHMLPERMRFTTGHIGESLILGLAGCLSIASCILLIWFI